MIEKTPDIRESKNAQILRGILGITGISLNQAAAFLASMTFHLQIPYYLVIVFVFTLIFSFSTKNLSRAIIYTIASMVIGALITLGILLIPAIACELDVDYTITVYSYYAAKLLIFNLVVAIPSAIIGGLASET
jgi:hypothetical protein